MTDSLKASVSPRRFFAVDVNILDGLSQLKLYSFIFIDLWVEGSANRAGF